MGQAQGIQRADIAPINMARRARRQAIGRCNPLGHRHGNDIVPEIHGLYVATEQGIPQPVGLEHINAHGHHGAIRFAGNGGGVGGLFQEGQDAAAVIGLHHAKAAGLIQRNDVHGHRYRRA